MLVRGFVVALTLALSASLSHAAASILWFEYPNGGVVPGYKTYDLYLNIDGTWCCSAMLFELSRGSFYQDPLGDVKIHAPYLPAISPTVAFDTYVAEGGHLDVGIIGGAGDVGGPAQLIFDEFTLNVSWGVLGGQRTSGFFKIARITMTTDAVGSWRLATIGADTPYTEFSGTVADIVPEPAAVSLLTVVGLLISARRTRPARAAGR